LFVWAGSVVVAGTLGANEFPPRESRCFSVGETVDDVDGTPFLTPSMPSSLHADRTPIATMAMAPTPAPTYLEESRIRAMSLFPSRGGRGE